MAEVERVWVDGRLLGPAEPAVSALDHGISVGDGAFEALKVVDGVAFAMGRHLVRFRRTLTGLGLSGFSEDRLREGIETVLGGSPIPFGRLRYVVTAGRGPLGSARLDAPLTYIVAAATVEHPDASGSLVTAPWTRNERAATAGLKTTSYADNVIALAYATDRGAVEAVFANTRDELCECTGSNVFVVRDGVAITPPLASGALAGVTRELTLEWAREAGVPVREEPVPMSHARDADEVFITSTTKDVLPIHAWDDRSYAAPGPLTARLVSLFAERAASSMDP